MQTRANTNTYAHTHAHGSFLKCRKCFKKCRKLIVCCIWQCQAGGEGITSGPGCRQEGDDGQSIISHTHLQIGHSSSSKSQALSPACQIFFCSKASKGPRRACRERRGCPRQNPHRPPIGLVASYYKHRYPRCVHMICWLAVEQWQGISRMITH